MEEETSPEALLLTAEQDLDAAAEIPFKEELVEEVMQELYRELHSKAPSDSAAATASFLAAGDAESCGASVSDSVSTVMAGIEPVGPAAGRGSYYWWGCVSGPVDVVGMADQYHGDHRDDDDHDDETKKIKIRKGLLMDGCDGDHQGEEETDDEWLARVLSWGPVEVDPIPGF